MTQEQLQKFVTDLKFKIDAVFKPDRYLFDRDIELARGRKLRGGFFYGTSGNPPPGWNIVNNTTGRYTVEHNLGTDRYGVVATTLDGGAGNAYAISAGTLGTTTF